VSNKKPIKIILAGRNLQRTVPEEVSTR